MKRSTKTEGRNNNDKWRGLFTREELISNISFLFRLGAMLLIALLYQKITHAQTHSIILGRPTDTSITASILFDQNVQYYLEYGTVSGNYPNTTTLSTNTTGTPDEIDLHNLLPDTKYYYRLNYKLPLVALFTSTPEYTFQTQRAKGSTFMFTIEADEHLYDKKGVKDMYQVCLDNQAKDKPDFMLSLGDIFGDDHHPDTITSATLDILHKNYRPFLGSLCHSVPFYVCLGNHEGENDYYLAQTPPNNLAVNGTLWRKYYYPNPYPNGFYTGNTNTEPYGIGEPENYYAWNWGDALFVVLDVYRDQCDTSAKPQGWSWSLGLPEYTWLKNTLESSTQKFKFVFAHHVRGQGRGGVNEAKLFEWGGYEQNGTSYTFPTNRPGWAKPIHQLFVDNGVNIFFQGHDHLFAHEVMNNVTYQEVPMAADSTYQIGMLANADAYTSDTLDGTGHLRVTVNSTCVKVDYVRAYLPADTLSGIHHNGEVAFSYSIGDCWPVSVNNVTEDVSFKVYPNPANETVKVDVTKIQGDYQINLFNSLGMKVLQKKSADIDISHLPDGIYLLEVESGKFHQNQKLIIHHP